MEVDFQFMYFLVNKTFFVFFFFLHIKWKTENRGRFLFFAFLYYFFSKMNNKEDGYFFFLG